MHFLRAEPHKPRSKGTVPAATLSCLTGCQGHSQEMVPLHTWWSAQQLDGKISEAATAQQLV